MAKEKSVMVLEKYGAENIKGYTLVNNWGYTFTIDGKKYDARFWENCYGSSPMVWGVSTSAGDRELAKRIESDLNKEEF